MPVVEALDLNLSADRALKAVGWARDGWRGALDARQGMDENIAGLWERYESLPPKRTLPFKQASNLRIPLTQWVIDGILVRMMRTVFGQLPYIRILDEDLEGAPEALPTQAMVHNLLETDLAFRAAGGQLFLNGLVEGAAIGKVNYDIQTRKVRDRLPSRWQRIISGDVLLEQEITDKIGLRYDVLDMKDFAVADAAEFDVNKQPWVGHRVWLRWDEIKRRQEDGRFTITKKQLDELKPLGKKKRQTRDAPLDQAKAELDQADSQGFTNFDQWEFVELEAKYDHDEDGYEEDCLLTISPDYQEVPMRAQKMPFWNGYRNYVVYRPIPRSNRFYGRSMAKIVQPLQDEADTRINQDLDATTIAILAGLTPILPRSAKREWEKHKWKLLEPIYVDTPEHFRTLAQAIIQVRSSDPQLDRIFGMAERVSGMSDPQLGKPAEGSKTAFEIRTVTSEGNIKFSEMIERTQLGNRELGYQVIEHAYQLHLGYPEFAERITKVAGRDPFEGVGMAQIRRRWGVLPTGNTLVANRDIEMQKRALVLQMFGQDPFVVSDPKRMWYLRSQWLQAAGLEREVELIIGPEEQAELMQVYQLFLKAMQGDPLAMNELMKIVQKNQENQPAALPAGETPVVEAVQ